MSITQGSMSRGREAARLGIGSALLRSAEAAAIAAGATSIASMFLLRRSSSTRRTGSRRSVAESIASGLGNSWRAFL